MNDSHFEDGFYREQIYGDQLPSPTYTLPRQRMVTIDPVVGHRSSLSSPGLLFPLQYNEYRDMLYNSRKLPKRTLVGSGLYTAKSTGNIVSEPATTRTGYRGFSQKRDRIFPRLTLNWNEKLDGKYLNFTKPIEPKSEKRFYSLEDGLDWESKIRIDEYEEKSANKRLTSPPPPSRTSPLIQTQRKRPPLMNEPIRLTSYDITPPSFGISKVHRRQVLTNEAGRHGNQYRTVLYIIPKIPTEEQESKFKKFWQTDKTNQVSCQPHELKSIISLPGKTKLNGKTSVKSNRYPDADSFVNKDTLIEYQPYQQSLVRSIDPNPGIVQERKRFCIEDQPYYQTLPSPRQMAINMPLNGYHSLPHRSIDQLVQPTSLRLTRTDYNQVVVDIKPRKLNEADKQQHVSQWIQLGTLGDTLNSQSDEQCDSTLEHEEHSDLIQPSVYDDLTDHDVQPEDSAHTVLCEQQPSSQTSDTARSFIQSCDFVQPIIQNTGKPRESRSPIKTDNFDYGIEQSTTAEKPLTDNTEINGTTQPSMNRVKKIYKGRLIDPPLVFRADTLFVPPASCDQIPEHISSEQIITSKANRTTPQLHANTEPSECDRALKKSPRGKDSIPRITRTQSERRHRPQVPPKPSVQEQLAAILDRRPMTTTGAEIRYLNSKISSRLSQPNITNGTLPRCLHLNGRPALTECDSSHGESYLESARDTPVPNVRYLTAYFSDLIDRQTDPNGSITSVRSSGYSMPDDRGMSFNSFPFLLHRETPEERDRRLQAVEHLRSRISRPVIDYTRAGSRLSMRDDAGNALDEYYPYCRPMSAPKIKGKFSNVQKMYGVSSVSDATR